MENLTKKQKIIFIGMMVLMLGTVFYYFMGQESKIEPELEENTIVQNEQEEKVEEIVVHVTGCVVEEGIVKLKVGDRIADAIEQAGGTTSDADMSKVNLAYKLKDGQKLYIPSNIDEEATIVSEKGEGIAEGETQSSGKVNINTATQTELETLSGIGPSTALKIIQYRNDNGEFSSIEDIKNVSGIGEAKYESIKDSIEV